MLKNTKRTEVLIMANVKKGECFCCRRGFDPSCGYSIAEYATHEEVTLVAIKDPDTNKLQARGYICDDHYSMYDMDGYQVIEL